MRRIIRENGLSLMMFGLFFVFLVVHSVTGLFEYNRDQQEHGQSSVSYVQYLGSGQFVESVFENWESEFLQMGLFLLLTTFLYQKGSAVSKTLGDSGSQSDHSKPPGPDAPWPVRRGGWVLRLYENSLVLAFALLYLLSVAGHAVGGMWQYNEEQRQHGGEPVSLPGFLGTSDFWFQSFQNYQSEFLALGSMAVLTIFLRQKGSTQSKPVEAPNSSTGP
jgi:hypothetical protein